MADVMQGTRMANQGDRSQFREMARLGGASLSAAPQGLPFRQRRAEQVGQAAGVDIGSPLSRLSQIPTDDQPITAGLSIGPGGGPSGPLMSDERRATLSRAQKLQALADNARTPHVRAQARSLLRLLLSKAGEIE